MSEPGAATPALVDELIAWFAGAAMPASWGDVGGLCNLAVVESQRRRGVGRRLAAARISAAQRRSATTVVSALSHEGWQLYRTLGFRSDPVHPDRCSYLIDHATT